jgi:trimethylamine--corrinoid protein Co-methyltransferase
MVQRGPRGGHLRYLTRSQLEAIHEGTLEVLATVGLRVASERILEVFSLGGAEVDQKTKTVKIPNHVVEKSLAKAPRQFVLCGRNPSCDILLEGSRVYYGLGGTPTPFIRDVHTGETRRPTKKDFAEATRLGNALPNMSFIMAIAGAFDVPYQVEYEHEWEALFNNTEKPIVYSAPSAYSAGKVLEMASTIAGGMNELKRRPMMCLYSETIAPLSMHMANENIIEFAKAGIPITEGAAPIVGATGPGTITGAFVIANTENLAALTLSQLVNPGNPFVYAGWVNAMDPFSCRLLYGAPEFAFSTSVLNAQMAEFYHLPTFGFACPSDSKLPDAQAGAEAMQNALMNGLAGVNLCHDCGYLAGGSVGSMEMAVICDDVLGNVLRIIRGTEVSDETLAIDVIKEVGPEGNFLGHKHTLKHIRDELHLPTLFDRNPEAAWVKAGSKPLHQVAKEKAEKILKEHQPEPLPTGVRSELTRIVKQAEKERSDK